MRSSLDMRTRSFCFLALLTLFVCALTSCHRQNATGSVVVSSEGEKTEKDDPYVEGNKNIMRRENEEIQMFVRRYGWEMQRTPTGLYIEVLNPGKGELYKENDPVTLEYRTFLLSGEMIYCSDSLGTKHFVVNRSEEIDALHEAVQLLRPGAQARLVIPSYLAYGVAGDGDRICGLRPIMMEITLLENAQNSSTNDYIPNPYH
jgi:FKBP-type peptidyl-prolyl cis-trans isomerase